MDGTNDRMIIFGGAANDAWQLPFSGSRCRSSTSHGLRNRHQRRAAVAGNLHKDMVLADQQLAVDFNALGTPSFFINGRRLSGAQPLEAFTAMVDEELRKAKDRVAGGLPRAAVYAAIVKDGKEPPPPERKEARAPSSARPARGPASAPVIIEMFGDLECPFTRRVMPTLDAVEKKYRGKVRIVFRNLPLNFHIGAKMAAEAALEAYAQDGDTAFWKIVAAHPGRPGHRRSADGDRARRLRGKGRPEHGTLPRCSDGRATPARRR
jgi:protein-disulfide isomerase